MTTYIVLLGIFFIAVIGWVIVLATRGIARPVSSLDRCLYDLLNLATNSGFLLVKHRRSAEFIQFEKYRTHGRGPGIELVFPNVQWSENYIVELMKYCELEGITYGKVTGSDGTEFITVDFGRRVPEAYAVMKHVLLNIFQFPEDAKFHVFLEQR